MLFQQMQIIQLNLISIDFGFHTERRHVTERWCTFLEVHTWRSVLFPSVYIYFRVSHVYLHDMTIVCIACISYFKRRTHSGKHDARPSVLLACFRTQARACVSIYITSSQVFAPTKVLGLYVFNVLPICLTTATTTTTTTLSPTPADKQPLLAAVLSLSPSPGHIVESARLLRCTDMCRPSSPLSTHAFRVLTAHSACVSRRRTKKTHKRNIEREHYYSRWASRESFVFGCDGYDSQAAMIRHKMFAYTMFI